ncbi:hypothetical protein U1Q18_050434, partial [Sarracenia purpurea var. burkii]
APRSHRSCNIDSDEICEKLQRNHRKNEAVLSSLAGSKNRGGEPARVVGGNIRGEKHGSCRRKEGEIQVSTVQEVQGLGVRPSQPVQPPASKRISGL